MSIFSVARVTDDLIFDLLLEIAFERVKSITISNSLMNDIGISALLDFLIDQNPNTL